MLTRFPMMASLAGAALLAMGAATAQTHEPIQPITPPQQINLGLVELGKKLYFDPRLSKSGFISCNSCHNLSAGGTDNHPPSATSGSKARSTRPRCSTPASTWRSSGTAARPT